MPDVSIIMPVYNASAFIAEAIESVICQTYQSFELVIIDDCSIDNTTMIVQRFMEKDERIRLIRLRHNSGPAIARNQGIMTAKGRYIAFLDGDDVWLPTKLERQFEVFKKTTAPIVFSAYLIVDAKGKSISVRTVPSLVDYKGLLKRNHIGNLTGIYDSKVLPNILFNNVGHEDYAFWLEALRVSRGTAIGVKEPLAKYRLHDQSLSANKFKATLWTWRVYRDSEKLSLSRSGYYFLHQSAGAFLRYLSYSFGSK